jgi:hypothetical protein
MTEAEQRYRIERHYGKHLTRVIEYGILTDVAIIEDRSGVRQTVKVPARLSSDYNRK